ncbi:hypothetical protein HDE_10204 [Halotydeus destructor]|nr:hypothetical protein HDE_10204 [Halotydeus destructor]
MGLFAVVALFIGFLGSVYADGNSTIKGQLAEPSSLAPLDPSPTQYTSNISNLLTLLGFTSSRQAEAAILSQLVTSFIGLLATGKVATYIVPILVGYLILPLFKLVKSVGKILLFLGVAGWLLGTMVPMFLGYLGLTGAGAFVARAMNNAAGPYAQYIDMNPASMLIRGLQVLNMDSEECRLQLACRAGEVISLSYPGAIQYMAQSGALGVLEGKARSEPYAMAAIRVLEGKLNCEKELAPCDRIRVLEAYLDPQRVANASQTWATSFFEAQTTTTPPPPPAVPSYGNDLVVSAIKRLAQNYYSYDMSP